MNARAIVIAIFVGAMATTAAAQPAPRPHRMVEIGLDSGVRSGSGETFTEIRLGEVSAAGSPWLRLVFDDTHLGEASYVVLRSVANGDQQRLDARSLAEWNHASGVFVGDRVTATLHLSPVDHDVRVVVRSVQASADPPRTVESLCGADTRVPSTDHRVGRLFFGLCTAFRIANGSLMTAGHCADFDPDAGGSQLPDNVLDLAGVVEFNVPLSDDDGVANPAALDDQYPIIASSVNWNYDGDNQGLGKDWCVFRVGRNANTNLLPHQVHGIPFRVTRDTPAMSGELRVTGFGLDPGSSVNVTNQTSAGPFTGETNPSTADWSLSYQVDTRPANSGSPVIWTAQNVVIGIHTNAGCSSNGTGSNSGTSFEVDALELAMNDNPGTGTEYVDNTHPTTTVESGSLFRPWDTIAEGMNAVITGRTISFFKGTYPITPGTTITRAMTFVAPTGAVIIQ
jgi:Trypsin-like peptidase domain